MYFIIVGGGKVGYYLSQALLREGHEVLILEKAPFDGILTIEVGGSTKAIGPEAASFIRVEPI